MVEITYLQIAVAIVTVGLGLAGLGYGIWRAKKSRAEMRVYMLRKLPQQEITSLAKELAQEVPIEGLSDWRYEAFLRNFDIKDDEDIGILSELDLQRWLNLQKEMTAIASQLKDRDRRGWAEWKIRNVIGSFTQIIFDEEELNLLLGLQPETLAKILAKIKEHRSAVAAQDSARSTGEAANA